MRVVLATSPHVRHMAVLQNDFAPVQAMMYSFAPVGLLALASVLRRELRTEPVLFDTNHEIVSGSIVLGTRFYESAADRICAHEPDVVGFMTECDSYHHVLQMLEQVKRRRPDCVTVLGGPHASAVARRTLERRSFIDAIVIGEGERTLPDLIRVLDAGSDAAPPGVLRSGAKGLVDGGAHPLVPNLDDLPMPAYDLYAGSAEEEIFIEVGRGCPFKCTFCSTAPFWQRKHRVKSPSRILAEIRWVQQLFRSRRVHFTHDLLTTDRRWVADLCQHLIEAGVPVKWTCSARTDTVDAELMRLMAAAGCDAIYFGIESGSPRMLRVIQKDIPLEESLAILRLCREIGITPNAGFIAGLPDEDRASLKATFDGYERALGIGARPTHIFGFSPFASSSVYADLKGLTCDGHFLDMPIHPAVDEANRDLIKSDRDLFGSYFRPNSIPYEQLRGIDEFSCLVEPVVLPALKLARAVGGMLAVFERWREWVADRNARVDPTPHRRCYGSPLNFCEFVIDQLQTLFPADDPMLQLAQVTRTSLEVAGQWATAPPTRMATHRSVAMPQTEARVELSDRLQLNTVVATMRVDYDVVPLIEANAEDGVSVPERMPTCLMWHLTDDRQVRLSRIDPFLYASLQQLRDGPQPVASLVVGWATEAGERLDCDHALAVLSEARTLRIVDTVAAAD
jgi:radical SAM superfamily enzyme YgiQ (UPF0313 family)